MKRSPGRSEGIEGALAAALPRTLWIELTSKCPFDCLFCSRKVDRGTGEHLDFALYRSLIAQLERAELIRLNYSGESVHYPLLEEAVGLARATGAVTELVSAFASVSPGVLRGLVDAGLHRLSISLHTMDPEEYRRIYRFGSLAALFDRIAELAAYKRSRGTDWPEVDFAFVAMQANLAQLGGVVAFAREAGAKHVSIHPVIRRSPILYEFPEELRRSGELRDDFAARLGQEVRAVRAAYPEIAVTVARPESAAQPDAGLTTCEQNPWETVHILANGDVVVCEVQDKVALGNLRRQSLQEIWLGEAYRNFRARYVSGEVGACRTCPWRRTMAWEEIRKSVLPDGRHAAQFVRGWHPPDGEPIVWSHDEAAVLVEPPAAKGRLRLAGILPPGPQGRPNVLTVSSDRRVVARVTNHSGVARQFDVPVPANGGGGHRVLSFATDTRYCPAREGTGPDLRELGFAFISLRSDESTSRRREETLNRVFGALGTVDAWAARTRFLVPALALRASERWAEPGISIVIPERANAPRLGYCLASVAAVARRVSEPVETIVVVNGSPASHYAELRRAFPAVRFLFYPGPLGFTGAVRRGLQAARMAWSYLLNNDMVLDADALACLLPLRSRETFAASSRIEMADASLAGLETNWTDYGYQDGVVTVFERDPQGAGGPRGSLYAGGGSALFQTKLLRRLIRRSDAYAPFYWEDVEWGALAWRHGFRTVFCPESHVRHGYRSTINQFYPAGEVQRVFERNRCLFHLRNLKIDAVEGLRARLLRLDESSWRELFRPQAVGSLLRDRADAALSPNGEEALRERWREQYLPSASPPASAARSLPSAR